LQDDDIAVMHDREVATGAEISRESFFVEARNVGEGDAFCIVEAAFRSLRRKRSAGTPESFMDTAG
jgi:hypothetical protein